MTPQEIVSKRLNSVHNQTRDVSKMPKPRTDMERDLQKGIVDGSLKNTVYCTTCDLYEVKSGR